jgi:tripartite-type tricarboxylate transporter receptor subunit TctC
MNREMNRILAAPAGMTPSIGKCEAGSNAVVLAYQVDCENGSLFRRRSSNMFNVLRVVVAIAAWHFVWPNATFAQTWPSKPIRVIVPLTAGSAADVVPRIVFEQVSAQLGQSMIVENRTGGGGTIGALAVARAEPDGYTVLVHSNAHTIAPAVHAHLGYDVIKDFAGITPLGNVPNVLVIAPSKGIKTIQELVAKSKAAPGSINYASGGTGTPPHLTAERFRVSAGFTGQHIPFRGAPEALTEVLSGRVDYYFSPIAPALPFIRDGKLIALAVSSTKRSSALPDVPTTVESGFADSDFDFYAGMWVPAKTPRDIVARLHAETVKALASENVQGKLRNIGVEPMIMTPEEFDKRVAAEVANAGVLAKAAGIAAQ